ncbi:uncharacterized protein BDV17DRAFT_204502 [Aspergillus undulatus]|uniref:uncharacterized protein n=1 Tax=Aspergillus undulatus TaxID=1810928 RepID=UPI003CCD9B1F
MQTRTESGWILQAPGPIIPTYRPSSQASKRAYTMSALAPKHQKYLSMADELPSTGTNTGRASNENVTEIVRFLQTHVASQTSSQTTGPKDMIKAGQRRLRLALRTKKGTDTKAKVDEASRQLAALQNQGSFPRSQYRKWGHKRSVPSIASSSKSVSELSFKSNSKRDVEEIGRPWLEHPLKKRDEPGSKGSSQVSSLDLRDLASFVEAAVNFSPFEDPNPPPYRPGTEQYAKPTVTAASGVIPEPVAKASSSNMDNMSGSASTELPIASRFNRPAQSMVSSENQNFEQSPEESKSKGPTKSHRHNSSTSSKSPSAPTTPVLKLFPDTMPTRTSSSNAFRAPAVRSPTPNRCFSPVPGSQSTPALASVFESDNREFRNSSSSLPKIRENGQVKGEKKHPTTIGPERHSASAVRGLETQDAQAKHNRRPSSLPPGAIDAFPIPAPVKPLPSVPEPLRLHGNRDKKVTLNRPTAQLHTRHEDPGTPRSMPPDINISSPSSSENSSPGRNNGTSRGRDSPFPRLMTSPEDTAANHDTLAGPPVPIQPRRGSLGKAGRTREAKVRSLIMRDLATSRHQRNSSKDQVIGAQSSQTPREDQLPLLRKGKSSQLNVQQQYQRKVSRGPSSPPPRLPPPTNPSRQAHRSRRYCTAPASTMTAAIKNFENMSPSTRSGDQAVHRKKSLQKIGTKHERPHVQRIFPDQEETPLPSSDDEGPDGDFYWNSPRKSSGRRRRGNPAPIVINKPTSERGRSLKKHQATGSIEPATQQAYRRRDFERAPQTHVSSLDHRTYEPQTYLTPEPKPNPSLEGRIEHLERQNKILQAALLAALDVGVKQDLSSLLGVTPPLTGTSFSSTTNTASSETPSIEPEKIPRSGRTPYRPESWIASPDSFDKGSFISDGDRELEEMMDDIGLNWLSDQSSVMA